jgi:hypothetical protein
VGETIFQPIKAIGNIDGFGPQAPRISLPLKHISSIETELPFIKIKVHDMYDLANPCLWN